MRKVLLYSILCMLMCFTSACIRMPKIKLFKPGRYLSYQLEPGKRQAEIAVSIDKLWKATVFLFRKYQIIESDPANKTISVVSNNVVYEFEAKERTRKNSAFTLKAYVIDTTEPKTKEARLMARKIYKKAKSMKFTVKNIVNKEEMN